ncbi:hypothetical protein BLS_006626 [Venturia inaequalis]|uniref:Uncharacterized protein n=1 Tax=Venturia inaequalis TaxID=5025 RepID=A0A8H3UBE2_VENIN|nr:hypothetical protein BLS_006626 [Venturia inaequalis]
MSARNFSLLPPSRILLPPLPKREQWFEIADKKVRERSQSLNQRFRAWQHNASGYRNPAILLERLMQDLKKARSHFRKHSRAIKKYLLKKLAALYDERADGYPCEFLSSADRMKELSIQYEMFDNEKSEAYRALSKIERNRQTEEDVLENMQEDFEEAGWQLEQDREERLQSRNMRTEGTHPVAEDGMMESMQLTDLEDFERGYLRHRDSRELYRFSFEEQQETAQLIARMPGQS